MFTVTRRPKMATQYAKVDISVDHPTGKDGCRMQVAKAGQEVPPHMVKLCDPKQLTEQPPEGRTPKADDKPKGKGKAPKAGAEYDKLKHAELVELCADRGVEHDKDATKQQMIDALIEADAA